jgi:hypothetical protein
MDRRLRQPPLLRLACACATGQRGAACPSQQADDSRAKPAGRQSTRLPEGLKMLLNPACRWGQSSRMRVGTAVPGTRQAVCRVHTLEHYVPVSVRARVRPRLGQVPVSSATAEVGGATRWVRLGPHCLLFPWHRGARGRCSNLAC